MTSASWLRAAGVAALAVAGLSACERGADSGATANPNAPGRPGTGNPAEVVSPVPGSITESPQTGGARAQVSAGVTGSGGLTDTPGGIQGRTAVPQPGVGLQGGLGAGPAAADSSIPPGATGTAAGNAGGGARP